MAAHRIIIRLKPASSTTSLADIAVLPPHRALDLADGGGVAGSWTRPAESRQEKFSRARYGPGMMLWLSAIPLLAAAPGGMSVKLFEDEAETSYLDVEQGDRRGSERIVWITHEYRKKRADGIKYSRDQWSISCERRTFSIFAVVEYDARGRVIRADAIPLEQRRPNPIPAGGRMETVFRIVCA
jgi:hypothetical protein